MWSLNDSTPLTLEILNEQTINNKLSPDTQAVFILILATVLRCYELRTEFLKLKEVDRLWTHFEPKTNLSIEASSYLIG